MRGSTKLLVRIGLTGVVLLAGGTLPAVDATAGIGHRDGAITDVVLSCGDLGQVTVAIDVARPNAGGARVVSGAGVRLVASLPIVATDRRTGASVRVGTLPGDAIACDPVPFSGVAFRDAAPPGSPPPDGVSAGDLLDGRVTMAVTVRIRLGKGAPASSLPLFPYDAELRSYLSKRTDVGAIALFDRQNGTVYGYFPTRMFITASIVKADILATLLHQGPLTEHQKALAKLMIEQSDNDAATELWWDAGGGPGVAKFNALIPMPSTTMGSGGAWALTQTDPPDQVALLRTIAYPNPLLSTASRGYELSLMRNVIPEQRWGVSAGVPTGALVALKNGWFLAGGTWHINSIGAIGGEGLEYSIAVLTANNGTETYGIDTIEALSRLIVARLPRPAPSVASASGDTLDAARRTPAGPVEHLSWSGGTWSAPESLGGALIGAPSLVAAPNGLDLFARGYGSNVSWRHQTGGRWSGWAQVPGQTDGWASSSPAAVLDPDGSVRVFVRGSDGALWTDTVDAGGTWSGWKGLGAQLDSGPSACASASASGHGAITVAMVGADDGVWTGTLNGSTWSGWAPHPGLIANGDPAVVCDPRGVELFARGEDGGLWTATRAGAWTKLNGTLGSGPSATVRGSSVEALARFTDGNTYRKTRDGAGHWSGWSQVP